MHDCRRPGMVPDGESGRKIKSAGERDEKEPRDQWRVMFDSSGATASGVERNRPCEHRGSARMPSGQASDSCYDFPDPEP